jgi:hypothetical protein
MTTRNKTIFFLSLVTLFFVATPLIIFYSLGWRINWLEKKPEMPGIFYFKILPKSSQIFINGKLKKKTDFFFGSALIENLSPKKYLVEIKKEGFQTWKKTLEIKKGQATEAKNILLLPQNPQFNIVSNSANQFWVSPDEKNIVIKETIEKSPSGQEASWFLSLFDLDKNLKIPLVGANDLLSAKSSPKNSQNIELLSLKFSFDSKKIMLEISQDKKIAFYLLDLDKNQINLNYVDLPNAKLIKEIYFEPTNSQKILFLQGEALFEKNLAEAKEPSLFKKDVLFFWVSEKYIFYLNNSGFLFRINPISLQEDKLNATPFQLKKEAEYKIFVLNSYVFLKENNALYKLDEREDKFELVTELLKDAVFSPDAKKIVYFTDKEIWLLFLEKIYDQPSKEKGEKLFLTRFSDPLNQIFWLSNYYLIFNSGGKIKVAEIDDRDNVNIFDIGEFPVPKIFWSQKSERLFVLSEKNLYSLEKLIP